MGAFLVSIILFDGHNLCVEFVGCQPVEAPGRLYVQIYLSLCPYYRNNPTLNAVLISIRQPPISLAVSRFYVGRGEVALGLVAAATSLAVRVQLGAL
jgi:hypothetical protein